MTPHIEAEIGSIAKTVLMPGDPLRAEAIANKYLENVKLVNKVRNMYAYTGTYKGKEITIMASGMGMPSIGIYSYELYKEYGVENIIRIGSAGSYVKELDLYDLLLVDSSYSDSTYAKVQSGDLEEIEYSNNDLNDIIKSTAKELNITLKEGRVYSSDVFYKEDNNYKELVDRYETVAVEMESFALFHNAKVLNKKATCLLTISDSLITKKETTSIERQNNFNEMAELALESAIKL